MSDAPHYDKDGMDRRFNSRRDIAENDIGALCDFTTSFVNPSPLAHADTPRDILPRGDGYHKLRGFLTGMVQKYKDSTSQVSPPWTAFLTSAFHHFTETVQSFIKYLTFIIEMTLKRRYFKILAKCRPGAYVSLSTQTKHKRLYKVPLRAREPATGVS
ncbi:hypothetical protein TNCV_2100691 [Trichonephila clavipes]|nr:hypothetical protein TNCV_2100691 [Trichonephila clavipes]